MFREDTSCHVPQGVWPDGVAEKGTWHGGKKANGTRTATLSCPACGKIGSLGDHKIDAAGHISPSVVCPQADCKFHRWVVLDDWKP